MRSIRFSSRARTKRQKGFVLVASLVLSILYFALMSLLLIDTTRALHEANRFRARIVAATLAENGVELAAQDIITITSRKVVDEDFQGTVTGTMTRSSEQFQIDVEATAIGVLTQKARVRVQGRVVGNVVKIDYTMHSQ